MTDPFKIESDLEVEDGKLVDYSKNRSMGDYLPTDEKIYPTLVSPIKKGQIYGLYILITGIMFIIFCRLCWLQVFLGANYKNIAEGNRTRIEKIRADRGLIYDRNHTPLVRNMPDFSLILSPEDLPRYKEDRSNVLNIISLIAEQLKIKTPEFDQQIKEVTEKWPNCPSEIILRENLDYQNTLSLRLKLEELSGLTLRLEGQREYLLSDNFSGEKINLFAHLLGYIGKITQDELAQNPNYAKNDLIGKTGLEYTYKDFLRGQDGEKEIEVNVLGRKESVISQKSPKTGYDLVLAIDADLQKKAAEALIKNIKAAHSSAGSVIVMDPNNGEILSIFSWPTYDNNLFSQGLAESEWQKIKQNPKNPLLFRAISGEYPSGSTIKPVLAAAALAEGIINEKTTVLSVGGIRIGKWFFPDWKQGGHGPTNVFKALAESVNTFFYYVAGGYGNFVGLGPDKIKQYAQLFGLGQLTEIDLPGESDGFLPTPKWKEETTGEPWYIGDTYHLGIGQGDLLVTPLQVANYTAAIANGGRLYQPHLVKEMVDPESGYKKKIAPEIIRENFIKPEYLDLVKKGLRLAVTNGSARGISGLKITVAGKTGTAQVEGKQYHAWFTGFAPYEKPEIVVTVLVENGGEGSSVAVPVAREILEWWSSNRGN